MDGYSLSEISKKYFGCNYDEKINGFRYVSKAGTSCLFVFDYNNTMKGEHVPWFNGYSVRYKYFDYTEHYIFSIEIMKDCLFCNYKGKLIKTSGEYCVDDSFCFNEPDDIFHFFGKTIEEAR